jgi:tRNA 2-thiouridine synthesizing protein A
MSPIDVDAVWDAGDMGCGELVLELRTRLARMQPGQILELTARDSGAPADVSEQHPVYQIRRKES